MRLEYVNRRVACKFCKHQFFSKAKIRVPDSAPPDLAAAIEAVNRGQAIGGAAPGPADSAVNPSHVDLLGSGDYPQLDGAGTDEHATLGVPVGLPIAPTTGSSAEMDLRGELDRLLAQLESARADADATARVAAELRSTRSECEQLRVTVKILKGDLAKRAPDADRLRARVSELERLLAEAETARHREHAEPKRPAAAELDRFRSHAEVLAAERDAALRDAAVARRECAVHQSEAERLAGELEQTRQEMARVANHGVELSEHLHRLGDELERQARDREAERQAHRKALESARHEWEARLRTAESAGRRKTAEETESLRAAVENIREERDAALRLVDDLNRTRKHDAGRIAELEAERDGIEAKRQAAASELEQLHERLAELERTRSGAPSPQAEAAIGRREEERRALIVAAERLSRERDNASAQLGETLLKLEDAHARVEALKGEVEAEREARRAEADAARAANEERAARQQESDKLRADAERLSRDLEKALKARAGEAGRGRQLAEKLKLLEAELADERSKHEAEARAQQLAIEELQIRLKYGQRSGKTGADAAAITDDRDVPDQRTALPPPGAQTEEPSLAQALEEPDPSQPGPAAGEADPETSASNGEALEPDEASTPLELAFGPNAPESPDERIAALRLHLRKIHEAEEERMNKRLLRRLTRVWRSDSK